MKKLVVWTSVFLHCDASPPHPDHYITIGIVADTCLYLGFLGKVDPRRLLLKHQKCMQDVINGCHRLSKVVNV